MLMNLIIVEGILLLCSIIILYCKNKQHETFWLYLVFWFSWVYRRIEIHSNEGRLGLQKNPIGKNPILENYIKHTFVKLYEEKKVLEQNGYSVFNTGLVSKQSKIGS